jgi:hypothetical protein
MRLLALVMLLATASPAFAVPADCSKAAIPNVPVHGTVNGQPFEPKETTIDVTKDGMVIDGVHLDRYALAIQTDGIFNELTVNMMVPGGKHPDGRVFRVLPTDSIHDQPAAAPGTPEVQGWDLELESAQVDTSFTQDIASIRVELGTRKGDVLPGKIYFCVPSAKAEIMGTFNATVH